MLFSIIYWTLSYECRSRLTNFLFLCFSIQNRLTLKYSKYMKSVNFFVIMVQIYQPYFLLQVFLIFKRFLNFSYSFLFSSFVKLMVGLSFKIATIIPQVLCFWFLPFSISCLIVQFPYQLFFDYQVIEQVFSVYYLLQSLMFFPLIIFQLKNLLMKCFLKVIESIYLFQQFYRFEFSIIVLILYLFLLNHQIIYICSWSLHRFFGNF